MKVTLEGVSKGRRERALPATSVVFTSGAVSLATAETEQRPTILGLIAAGRMRPATGQVLIDGQADAAALRRRVALVDAPGVSDPAPDVTLAGVIAEELMFAGTRSDPLAVSRWIAANDLAEWASTPIANVPPAARIRALCETATLRSGVEALVIVSPDRHGGDPLQWWRIAESFARRDLAVLVIAGAASHAALTGGEAGGAAPRRPRPSGIRLRRLTTGGAR